MKGIIKKNNYGSDSDQEENVECRAAKKIPNVSVPGEPNRYNTALARQSRTKSCKGTRSDPYIPNGEETRNERRSISKD